MARGHFLWLQPDRAAQRDDHAGAGRLSLLSSMRHFSDSRVGSTLWRADTHSKRTDNKRLEPLGAVSRIQHRRVKRLTLCLFLNYARHSQNAQDTCAVDPWR
jgi:hypothetical protein